MSLSKDLPIMNVISQLQNDSNSTKLELLRNTLLKYNIHAKETDGLFVLYYENDKKTTLVNNKYLKEGNVSIKDQNKDPILTTNLAEQVIARDLEEHTRSIIFDKETFEPIVTQYSKILYNADAVTFLKTHDWSKVITTECYEGTVLLLFNHKDKWYVSTRRCIDASESSWIQNKSYKEMFDESIENLLNLDEFDKQYCYHFVLLHHKNRNIVQYTQYGKNYKMLIMTMITHKNTLNEVTKQEINTNPKLKHLSSVLKVPENQYFSCFDEAQIMIESISNLNEVEKRISMEGLVFRYYEGELYNSKFTVLKIQTELYQKLLKLKPNNSNLDQIYLELYQTQKLNDFIPYFSQYSTEIIRRINTSMKNLSREILNLYHGTRQKKNKELYDSLSKQYRDVLWQVHGLYINNRKLDFSSENIKSELTKSELTESKSITVHDIYYYLKKMPSQQLRQLFYDRMSMLKNNIVGAPFLNKNCIHTKIQTNLMFESKTQ